eukprot:RCo011970
MGAGASSSAGAPPRGQVIRQSSLSAAQQAEQLLVAGLWQGCGPADKAEVKAAILADRSTTAEQKRAILTKLDLPFAEKDIDSRAQAELFKIELLASSEPLTKKAQVIAERKLWNEFTETEKKEFLDEVRRSEDLSQAERNRIFDALPPAPVGVRDLPLNERTRYKANILQSAHPVKARVHMLLESGTWSLCSVEERQAVRASILADGTSTASEKTSMCTALSLEVDPGEVRDTEAKHHREKILKSNLPLPEKVAQLMSTGAWQTCSDVEKEAMANKILASSELTVLKKKELLDKLGVPEFMNLVKDMLDSDEPLEKRVETLLASGCWGICTREEKEAFKKQILHDDKVTSQRKADIFALLELTDEDLPTPEKDALVAEILGQDIALEERLEFLLEGNLWDFVLNNDRERFKQDILQRGVLSPERKAGLLSRLGMPATTVEMEYRLSATSGLPEHKAAAAELILGDDELSLFEKGQRLQMYGVKQLTKPQQESLLKLILADSRFLELKGPLLSRFRLELTAEQKRRLKQLTMKSTDASLELKRSILMDFNLGSLNQEEKATFRHQIMSDPTLTMEQKRLFLLEFQIIKRSGRRTPPPEGAEVSASAEVETEAGRPSSSHAGSIACSEEREEDMECRQRIKAASLVVKLEAVNRRLDRESVVAEVTPSRKRPPTHGSVPEPESTWAMWVQAPIQGLSHQLRGKVLEVGREFVVTKRVQISPHFFASEVGIRADCRFRTMKTRQGTVCLVSEDFETEELDDEEGGQRDTGKPLEFWLNLDFKELVLHVSKSTSELVGGGGVRPQSAHEDVENAMPSPTLEPSPTAPTEAEIPQGPPDLVNVAVGLLEGDDERYVIKSAGGGQSGTLDYFTEQEYATFLLPSLQKNRSLLDYPQRSNPIINIPVHPVCTYSHHGVPFHRVVLQLVNPPRYSMLIINTLVSEMKLDVYRHETSETFRDLFGLVNGVAALGLASPTAAQLRAEVGALLFHRLMYTTTPKLLGKIRPMHDLIHREFVEKILRR